MLLEQIQPQLIVRNESIVEEFDIDQKYIVYVGLGHVVFNELIIENEKLLQKIKEKEKDNYFFRLSFMEDPNKNKNEVRSYLTKDLSYFKAKKITKTGKLCFLGIDLYVITLEKLSNSKNFEEVSQYRCKITSFSIDSNGKINNELLWDKVKYGDIENFVPKNLEQFKPFVKTNRERLHYVKK